ncbi:hypothetical protein [Emticicia agri]|uniref:DUF5666 domain-containing protein n=1 Tax=Emticicia agri TaxID=2492393 RepID=A0A4Q5LWL7_9BACT|nr:hypothetical protein [Emticicia agri]RYU94196.1 hypothetical protein EWM59_18005 [Emticicia agri]
MRKFGILFIGFMIALASCNKPATDSYTGTIESIENGKDGYVAILKDKQGEKFEAIFSIPNMGTNYKRWEVGQELSIKGDTIHLDNTYRVIARSVEER